MELWSFLNAFSQLGLHADDFEGLTGYEVHMGTNYSFAGSYNGAPLNELSIKYLVEEKIVDIKTLKKRIEGVVIDDNIFSRVIRVQPADEELKSEIVKTGDQFGLKRGKGS